MSELRVIVLGEISPTGRQWLGEMQREGSLEIQEATDQASIFEDYEKVGETPIVLIENFPDSRSAILALRQSGFPNFILWFGATFTKEDFEFGLENRVYAIFERPEPRDKKILDVFHRLGKTATKHSHFSQVVGQMKSLMVQVVSADEHNPSLSELKVAAKKLDEIQTENEFTCPTHLKRPQFESPTLARNQEELGATIESMGDLERTGALWVRGGQSGQEGRIEFLQGKIVFAEAGEASGLKAIYRMFLWAEPKFLFARETASEVPLGNNMGNFPAGYIAQGRRYRSEFEKLKEEVPPREIRLEMNMDGVLDNLELNPKDFQVLASVVEFGRVSEIVDYNPLSDCEIFQSLIDLRKSNIIRVSRVG